MNNCVVCGRQSDAAKRVEKGSVGVTFCGTDYDGWLASEEKIRAEETGRFIQNLSDFVDRRAAEHRRGINGVKIEPAVPRAEKVA